MSDKLSLRRAVEHGFIEADHQHAHLENPHLVSNDEISSMLGALRTELATADSFVFSVAFITADAIGMIKQQLVEFEGEGTIVTSDYLDFNDPDSLRELLTLENVSVRIMSGRPHHAKGYIFRHSDHITALIGSSNLTRSALVGNNEWNLQFSSHRDGDIADQLDRAVEWQILNSDLLTEEWIARYEASRKKRVIVVEESQPLAQTLDGERILPNLMQVEALENVQKVREAGERRALIISATGTGKTILSALVARDIQPRRMLFLAHREQILNKAAEEFRRVLECDESDIGFFVGARQQLNRRFVFATVQSLSQMQKLADISPLLFDLVIVDEVHRSGAETYRRVLKHFRPDFTLGLTATPERTDGFNVFELFDYNVPYEIRLENALESHMLVPFDYYGVSDYYSASGFTISDDSNLSEQTSAERVAHLVSVLQDYSFARGTKGLIFCSGNEEAAVLSSRLNGQLVHGRPLRTRALSGADSVETREDAVALLENGSLDYLLTVDIFNEGIDIPSLNVVVMLRGTQSSIIFTQQLGRGLRKYSGKHSLRVIDMIGNYANNYLIPIALTGDRSADKDEIRERIRRSRKHAVAGSSTISFDRVSMQRVVESLQKARLTSRLAKREAIETLRFRLGRVPRLIDFETHEAMNPFILASTDAKARNYWSLLHGLRIVGTPPSAAEEGFLDMLSVELLNGKRPQELLLLQLLLQRDSVTVSEFRSLLESRGLDSSEATINSVGRVLDLSWFVKLIRARYRNTPLVTREGNTFRLSPDLGALYRSYRTDHPSPETSFRAHVDDIIETGLLLNKNNYRGSDQLIPGKTYSRKDASRLLNWQTNSESTIMGYKVDRDTKTCPIFVTYHKDSEVTASQRYDDSLIDPSTMQWFSRHGRTLRSAELQPILHNDVALHLFVKREDADGLEFYYLGQAETTGAKDSTMTGNKGETLDVVIANLKLRRPMPHELFEAITASLTTAATP